jgi:ANTAR domain/PAS fold
MRANQRMSRVLDEHRFDALAASMVADPCADGMLWLDPDFCVRGVNAAYEAISMRHRDHMLGERVFDLFPDDPDDPQASGSVQLRESLESAMRNRGSDSMPIVRYDIVDPQNPGVFLPKLWTWTNTSVDDGDEHIGVLLHVAEISSLDVALSALATNIADGEKLNAAEQLHLLAALAVKAEADKAHADAVTQENEQLRRALDTRDVIGQAKGILMERCDVDAAAAFNLLVTQSQKSNTRLEELARKLVEIAHPD